MSGKDIEGRDWQRLDTWLWCARFGKARSDCAKFVLGGPVRLNRQPTEKAHARLRPGDILTMAWREEVRVICVLALAERRGPAAEARRLYEELPEASAPRPPEALHENRAGGISGAAGGTSPPPAPDYRQEC